jgi:serine/threonine protein kinase
MRRGQLIGERFEVEQLAARGGTSLVYRALDQTTGQPVALKILRGQHDREIARFQREARILTRLDHPLVVRYVAHGTLPTGELYLAMEWLDGEDLASRLARGPLTLAESITLVASVAEVLGVLHDQGIVHRDLKPGNIFLPGGRVDGIKLLDFGIARVETSVRMTGKGKLLGTVAYIAPEQARGEYEVDARADVFALGCVLFECLTAERAFSAASPAAILTRILFDDSPRLRDKLPGAPPPLDALMARLLSKHPERRPPNGRAVAAALRELEEMHGVAEPGAPTAIVTGTYAENAETEPDGTAATLPGSRSVLPPGGPPSDSSSVITILVPNPPGLLFRSTRRAP